MTDHTFPTENPVDLYVETGKGTVEVRAAHTAETTVLVSGSHASEVSVTQEGDTVRVIGPKGRLGLLGGDQRVDVHITVPLDSEAVVRTGSADVTLHGAFAACRIRSGSGDVRIEDVTGPGTAETGSGDVRIGTASAEMRIKSGSGDIRIERVDATVALSTGSGDVAIGATAAPVAVKSGSGDVVVTDAHDDVALSTGSGDLVIGTTHRGQVTIKSASGDVRLGIPVGTPVWTDITTLSGRIDSDLQGTGEPTEGQDHVEVRAKTASGSIALRQV